MFKTNDNFNFHTELKKNDTLAYNVYKTLQTNINRNN